MYDGILSFMKAFEAIKRHPYRTGAVALALGIAAVETVGYAKNPIYDPPEGSCVSPLAVSNTYVEPGTNTLLQTYSGLFTTGIVARGAVPEGAYGVEASFKAPSADTSEWDKNASDMTKANDAGGFALKMAIGSGEVQFGVRIVAPAGSELCTTVPKVDYKHLDQSGYSDIPGTTLPWRNPVAVVSNL